MIHFERGDFNRALFMFLRATRLNPQGRDAFNNLVIYFLRTSRMKNAISVRQLMINKFPEYADGYFRTVNALEAAGDIEKALEARNIGLSVVDATGTFRKAIERRMTTAQQNRLSES